MDSFTNSDGSRVRWARAVAKSGCIPIRAVYWQLFACAILACGCASTDFATLREKPRNPLAGPLRLFSKHGPKPTERTEQLLRRYDLEDFVDDDPYRLEAELQRLIDSEPTAEKVYALAQLSYIAGQKAEFRKRQGEALEMYGTSIANSYAYLVDDGFGEQRNPYDPVFRQACDLYNSALERMLRILQQQDQLSPGCRYAIKANDREYLMDVVLRGQWHAEEFEGFEFVSDYRVEGLKNHYRTYGLGVPLIGQRHQHAEESPSERYYPPGVTLPVTALLRVEPNPQEFNEKPLLRRFVLELYDPLVSTGIHIDGRLFPLETDLSTPLAFFLDNPVFKQVDLATTGLLNPEKVKKVQGLYMMEPYDSRKIPVLLVHGLWSSPMTWMEMYNDLRGLPEIREHYQFWFYLYPTGQPFWNTAAQLREDLVKLRETIDPSRNSPALDQIVLVGHSMGGLVSKMQTIPSHDDFWEVVSDEPFAQVEAGSAAHAALQKTLFFQPNSSIRRVVTIATPHRGSQFANSTTRWLGRKLIALPRKVASAGTMLMGQNQESLANAEGLPADTSIDSLAPESPILQVLYECSPAPWVKHHNIVGLVPDEGFIGSVAGDGDGIVDYESAHLEAVQSEIVVATDHVSVHRHPLSILEVRRILLEHARQLRSQDSN